MPPKVTENVKRRVGTTEEVASLPFACPESGGDQEESHEGGSPEDGSTDDWGLPKY